jgi:CBS domain-containing protein
MIREKMRPITAADLMNPKVLAVRDDLTLRDLAAFLIRNQITGAPVEDAAGRMVGVVSLVDIAETVLAARDGSEGQAESAGEEGSEPAAEEADEAAAGEAGEEGVEEPGRHSRLRVTSVSPRGEPTPEGSTLRRLVRDIMTPAVDSVPEDATVSEVASRMLDSQVHRLLVTREGRPVGIVTTSDLLGLLIDE